MTLPMLAGSGFLAALPLVRARLLAPAAVFGAAIGLATVVSWVQPVGDPIGGLLGFSTWYCTLALVLAGVELADRAALRGLRRRAVRNPASAVAVDPAASPSRS